MLQIRSRHCHINGSGWSLTVTEDGSQWLTGSIDSSARQAQLRLSDPTGRDTRDNNDGLDFRRVPLTNYKYTALPRPGQFRIGRREPPPSQRWSCRTKPMGTAWTWTYSDNQEWQRFEDALTPASCGPDVCRRHRFTTAPDKVPLGPGVIYMATISN